MTAVSADRICEIVDGLCASDSDIEALQAGKRDILETLRDELEKVGMTRGEIREFVSGIKRAAVRVRRESINPEKHESAERVDALADSIYQIVAAARAPRATPACDMEWSAVKAAASGFPTPNEEAA